ncbi:MAG: hypothetical protein WBS33_09765, partial [Verrucomicrobiia bacterium]
MESMCRSEIKTIQGKEIMSFYTWKTIRLGTGPKTADDFLTAFKKAGCFIGSEAISILKSPAFKVADRETEVELVNVSVGELGFRRMRRADIYALVQQVGLQLCPAEVGPQLRLQFLEQLMGEEVLRVGMEPIAIRSSPGLQHGGRFVFAIDFHIRGKLLYGVSDNPDELMLAYRRF